MCTRPACGLKRSLTKVVGDDGRSEGIFTEVQRLGGTEGGSSEVFLRRCKGWATSESGVNKGVFA